MSNLAEKQNFEDLAKILKRLEAKINQPTVVPLGEWVMPVIIEARHGLTEQAMREYRRKSEWAEGIHWQKNKKGRIVYNVKEIDRWMATPE